MRRGPAWLHLHTPELTGKETYRRSIVALSNTSTNASGFFLVHKTADLPKTATIIGAISNGLPVLDRITASPQDPARTVNALVG